jgi:hypothetical protein
MLCFLDSTHEVLGDLQITKAETQRILPPLRLNLYHQANHLFSSRNIRVSMCDEFRDAS